MAEAGVDDILVAYPIVTPQKAVRIAELAERAKMRVALDSTQAIECVSRAAAARGVDIGILVEIDGGLGRCGVGTPEESVALSRVADRMPGVRFDGLMFYPGHIKSIPNEQTPLSEDVNRRLTAHYAAFAAADIPLEIVSGGSTSSALRSHHFKGVTEIRPGTYAFLDRNLLTIGIGTLKECAVSVLVTVVSNAVNSRAIVDGGSKTFSSDPLWVGDGRRYGLILEQPDAELIALSEDMDISIPAGARARLMLESTCGLSPTTCAQPSICTTGCSAYGAIVSSVPSAWMHVAACSSTLAQLPAIFFED